MLLRALGVRDDRAQSLTIVGGDDKGDAAAHATDSHATGKGGIPNRTLLTRTIH
jgi:hypothetical protein